MTFSVGSGGLLLGFIVILVTAFLCWLGWRRSHKNKRILWLELIRLGVVTAVVVTLWQPEWRTFLNPEQEPVVAILKDGSRSMETKDVILAEDNVITRQGWLQSQEDQGIWNSLSEAHNVVEDTFSPPPGKDGGEVIEGTNLHDALEGALSRNRNLRAVVLVSDGDWNIGTTPMEAATKLRLKGVPVFAIPVGNENQLPDIELANVSAPTYGIVGEPMLIPFTIKSSLTTDVKMIAKLVLESGKEITKDVVVSAKSEAQEAIFWTPEEEGTVKLTMQVPVQSGEFRTDNNSKTFQISARKETIKVLVVETLPRWEYRFLRNALSRDPGVEVSCLLLHPDIGVGDGLDYITEFPKDIDELSKYDVIFLGDVGVKTGQLTTEQCEMIRGLVEQQASGLVFIPGSQGNQMTFIGSPLESLIPVVLDEENKKGKGTPAPSQLALTAQGKGNLLTLLADTEDENPAVWKNLPGFYWHAPILKSKGGSQVLAVHSSLRNKYGRIPILVTRPAMNGKVLYMGIDSAWRWRRGVEDLYHYRFWGQVARWMSYQRHMAAGEKIRLFYTPDRPTPGQKVVLNATVMDKVGSPLSDGTVTAEIVAPSGRTERLAMNSSEGGWGVYLSDFKPLEAGEYGVSIASPETDGTLETKILVQGEEREQMGQPARPDVLRQIADITRGKLGSMDEVNALISQINALPEREPEVKRVRIWSSWIWGLSLLLFVTIFWIGRKWAGVI